MTFPALKQLEVEGLKAREIGDIAAAHGVVLRQLVDVASSLEEAFMELTAPSPDFRGHPEGHQRGGRISAAAQVPTHPTTPAGASVVVSTFLVITDLGASDADLLSPTAGTLVFVAWVLLAILGAAWALIRHDP